MTQAPYHNRAQFERAVERLIGETDRQNRGQDLDRMVQHLQKSPGDVSRLASLLMMVDDDFRADIKAEVDAYRRFEEQKGRDGGDDAILVVMEQVYRRVRAL